MRYTTNRTRRTVRGLIVVGIVLAMAGTWGCDLLTAANYNSAIQGAATAAAQDITGHPTAANPLGTWAANALALGMRNWFLNIIPSVDTQQN